MYVFEYIMYIFEDQVCIFGYLKIPDIILSLVSSQELDWTHTFGTYYIYIFMQDSSEEKVEQWNSGYEWFFLICFIHKIKRKNTTFSHHKKPELCTLDSIETLAEIDIINSLKGIRRGKIST